MLGKIYDTTLAPIAPYDETPKDSMEAAKWYRMAAMQNHPSACVRLTRFYALGIGVPKNYLYALGWFFRWFLKSSIIGHVF